MAPITLLNLWDSPNYPVTPSEWCQLPRGQGTRYTLPEAVDTDKWWVRMVGDKWWVGMVGMVGRKSTLILVSYTFGVKYPPPE